MVSLKELNATLVKQPYIGGYAPSADDAACVRELLGDNVNVMQWVARMASYYPSERHNIAVAGDAAAAASGATSDSDAASASDDDGSSAA